MPGQVIRLTSTSYVVLGLLNILGPSTPYDLKRALEQSVENFWPVPHTTFYAEPERLAAAGYLTADQEPGGRRRKTYGITPAGIGALDRWVATAEAGAPQLRDDGMLLVFFGADPRPVNRARIVWHREKLTELEGYLDRQRATGGSPGVVRSLIAGTMYHRMSIELHEQLLALGEAATD
ncbi:MAG TPA: PadR family transcriptional regulator [Solirubrobacteraceae bacterium]|jgi:DNA-binding PadR family transcriptional regulator|nr:PadR family transcriptional regulator [Solirubrobacteraceae bacterium]